MHKPVDSNDERYDKYFDWKDTNGYDDLSKDPHFGAGVDGAWRFC